MNAVYKVIFNRTTGIPVVVSELGKGKVKSATNKRNFNSAIILSLASLIPNSYAADCDSASLECQLDSTWSYNSKGAVVSDGEEWSIRGIDKLAKGSKSYILYDNLRSVVEDSNGYQVTMSGNVIDKGALSKDNKLVSLPGLSKTILVKDEITQTYKSVSVYDSNSISEQDSYYFGTSYGFMIPNANVYSNTNFVSVTNGSADISFKEQVYNTGEIRGSNLVNVDGSNYKASATWKSRQTFIVDSPVLWDDTGWSKSFTTRVDRYNGTIETFETGYYYTINNLADLKNYNEWLINQIESGKLDPGENGENYKNELRKAFDSTKEQYTYSVYPQGGSSSEYGDVEGAIIHATGGNATATISNTGEIFVSQGTAVVLRTLLAENDATIINDGKVTGSGRLAEVFSGAKLINNGVLSLGGHSSVGTYELGGGLTNQPIIIDGQGSKFENNGIYNINARALYSTKTNNGVTKGITIRNGGEATNHGYLNSGYWGTSNKITSDAESGIIQTVFVGNGSSFLNDTDGHIQLGINEDGVTPDYLGSQSAAITIESGAQAINKGTITLGSTADAVYGLYAVNVNTTLVNDGAINIYSNGNDGEYMPGQSIGIYSTNNSSGTIDNAGTINLNGANNVGVKVKLGGEVSSSGIINVNKATGSSGLNNYGAWAEDSGSTVNIAGNVNLNGDKAIGVHARNGGAINLTGNAAVNFVSGENQIGYFIYGASSKINNSSTSTQNVSSDNSTLMRLDGGATFTGGATASTMEASGQDSVVLLATGSGTSVNTGSLTLDLTGQGATGVLIEGGATGQIESGTSLNLENASAIAAIADGNGHDLTGSQIVTGDTTTRLDSAAALNSVEDQVTGYIARNGATLENAGNITFSGADTTGMLVQDGSTGINSGSITIQDGSTGLVASSANQATVINNTGNLTLKGGSDANRTTGIQASGSAVTVNMTGGVIGLEGQGAIGVEVSNGATVNLAGTALPQFADASTGMTNQIAFLISGAGSSLNTKGTAVLDANGKGATLFRVEDGATQQGVLSYAVTGEDARGIWATGAGTVVDAAAGSHLSIQGDGAQGIYAAGGATASLAQGVTADLTGSGAVVGVVDGNEYDRAGNVIAANTGTVLTNEADITSGLAGATAFITQNQGMLVNKGNIDLTTGSGNTGIKVINGQFENQTSDITVSGVAVDVEGASAKVISTGGSIIATDGDAAIRLGQGAYLDLVGSGLGVVEGRGTAHGVLLDTGASGLIVNGARIDVNATGATGNGIENRAEIAGIQLNNTTINVDGGNGVRTSATLAQQNSGTINVTGSGTGLAFMTADGGITANDLDLSGSAGLTINLQGSGGIGILANTADGATVKSAAGVNITQADGGTALVVNNSADRVEQSGVLRSASTTQAVVDAAKAKTFVNTGDILASSDTALAMAFDDSVDTVLRNASGGSIQGVVAMNEGNNQVFLDDGSLLTGTITLGNGDNQVTLTDAAHADAVTAGSGNNTFTIAGTGASFNLLDGGMGSNDTLVFDAATHTVSSAASLQNFEQVALRNNSQLTLEQALILTDGGSGAGAVDIESGSELAVTPDAAGDFAFDPYLTGQGLMTVTLDSSQSEFAFTQNTGSDFAGTLRLNTGHYQLEDVNTSALTNATLEAGRDSVVTVGAGDQRIGGLVFDGGTVQFGAVMPGDIVADNMITTSAAGTLDISGQGTVQVTLGGGVINHAPAIDSKKSLMEQDDETTLVKIADAEGAVVGTGGQLAFVDENGTVISDAQQLDIVENGTVVAQGTWDYQMVSSADGITSDGLYIAYGLKEIELLGTGDDALTLAVGANAQGLQTDLRAKVTGSGDLSVDTGSAQTISLSNGGNDYTGETSVISGTLRLDNDGVLGQSSALNIQSGAAVEMNGSVQTVGALNTQSGSQLSLDEGSVLTLDGDRRAAGNTAAGTIAGNTLIGSGALAVVSGVVTSEGANAGYTGDVTLSDGAQASLNDVAGLGNSGTLSLASTADTLSFTNGATGALSKTLAGEGRVALEEGADITLAADNGGFSGIFVLDSGTRLQANDPQGLGTASVEDNGTLVLNNANAWMVENPISGSGSLVKEGAGTLTLTQAAAQYTGDTEVNNGALILGERDSAVSLASSLVTVNSGAMFGGYGGTAGDVTNHGALVLGEYGVTDSTGLNFTVGGNLTNAGTVYIGQNGGSPGNILNVNGDYTGNGGTLVFNTVLGDDSSATDRMIVSGSTSGNTRVSVTNAGGSGAATINGIELISVGGSSEGEFTQNGRIVAGAYDYQLIRGTGDNSNNWYLVSGDTTVVTPDPEPGTGPDTGTDTGGGAKPAPGPTPWMRPEAGLYGANLAAANSLFNHRLHDRLGETHYVDALTGETRVTSMWMRHVGGHTRSKDGSGQLNTQSNRYVMQLGGDIAQWSSDGQDRYHLGVMAGYANQKSNTRNNIKDYRADGGINGYSVGLYGTWLQDDAEKTGAWLDSWLLYNWFDNTVNGESAGSERYKSKGFTASLEGGYTWKLGERNERTAYYLQPKAQVIWMGVKADEHTEANGTRVSGEGDGNIQTRLGVRAFIKGYSDLDEGKQRAFEPFVEANWIHNTKTFGASLNGVRVDQAGTRNIGELKVGVEGQLSPNVNLWGNVSQQIGDSGYSDTGAMLGVKVSF